MLVGLQSMDERLVAVELGVTAAAEAAAAARRSQEEEEMAIAAEVQRLKRGFLIQVRTIHEHILFTTLVSSLYSLFDLFASALTRLKSCLCACTTAFLLPMIY
jgi:hypothetical protein